MLGLMNRSRRQDACLAGKSLGGPGSFKPMLQLPSAICSAQQCLAGSCRPGLGSFFENKLCTLPETASSPLHRHTAAISMQSTLHQNVYAGSTHAASVLDLTGVTPNVLVLPPTSLCCRDLVILGLAFGCQVWPRFMITVQGMKPAECACEHATSQAASWT